MRVIQCQRSIELVWLTGRLMPDFKKIADFRKNNGAARHSIRQELTDRVSSWNIEGAIRAADSTMEMEHGHNSVHVRGLKKSSS
jgi:transposase